MPTDEYDVQIGPIQKRNNGKNNMPEMSLDDLCAVLDTTIKYNNLNKCIVFLAMLSAYTESDQLNVCLLGESSSGKTYLAQEVASYFPTGDVLKIADATPKAFKYFEERSLIDEESNKYYIDLERVILLFQDMPGSELLKNLRTLMSHDSKELDFHNVNMSAQGRRSTETVTMVGFPSVIFCSANIRIDPQEATRCILLSPEVSKNKINASVNLTVERATNPEEYNAKILNSKPRQDLIQRILFIKNLQINSVKVPIDFQTIVRKYREINPKELPRDNRDIRHVLSLIKAVAMLNADNRIDEHNNVIANESDVDAGFTLWRSIAKTQECGIAPTAMDFYDRFIVPAYFEAGSKNGISTNELINYCNKNGKKISAYNLTKELLPTLASNGLIFYDSVPGLDGRCKYIKPLNLPKYQKTEEKSTIDQSCGDFELPRATSEDQRLVL